MLKENILVTNMIFLTTEHNTDIKKYIKALDKIFKNKFY